MSRMKTLSFALIGILGVGTVVQGAPVSVGVEVTPATHYLWRGYDILNGAKYPIQPSVTVGLDDVGLSANVWGSWALKDHDHTKYKHELDFTLDHSRDLMEGVGMSVGFIYYLYPNTAIGASSANTAELYASFGFDAVFSPSLAVYYDTKWFDDKSAKSDGFYFLASASHSLPAGPVTLDLGAGLSLAANDTFNGLQDLNVSVGTSVPVGPVSLTPFVSGAYIFENSVNSDNYEVFGGLTIGFSF